MLTAACLAPLKRPLVQVADNSGAVTAKLPDMVAGMAAAPALAPLATM